MQEVRQIPRDTLRAPDASQRHVRIGFEISRFPALKPYLERATQIEHVGDSEIQAFGTRRRHNMSGVSRKKQPSVAHWLRHEAAQWGDRLFDRRTLDDPI